jgi:hypothetical protein
VTHATPELRLCRIRIFNPKFQTIPNWDTSLYIIEKMVGIRRLISHVQKQHTIEPAIKMALNARVERDFNESTPTIDKEPTKNASNPCKIRI